MKYLIGSIVTIIIGYIFSGMLSGVVSFWGYLILDKLNKEKDLNEDIKNTCNKK